MGRSLNLKVAVGIVGALTVCAWLLLLAFNGIAVPFTWDALKEIPTAAGYVGTIVFLFAQWGWRIPIFRGWLVLVPDLNGTWKGKLTSTWIDPKTQKSVPPIDGYLVIRQSLIKISCVLLTKESKSSSRAATILIDEDHQSKVLEFTYSNAPRVSVQYRSTAHDGATVLDIVTKPKRKLIGKYWTDREPSATKGEIEFSFHSKEHRESFS